MRPNPAQTFAISLVMALSACQSSTRDDAAFGLDLDEYAGELKVIRLNANGNDYDFLYDTGGGYTILDAAYAGDFGCPPYGKTIGFRLTGEAVEAENCGPVTFDFGALAITTETKVMDVNSFLPDGLPALAGIFSVQTFRRYLVTIDYAGALITLETPGSFRRRTREMSELPLLVTNERNGESVSLFARVLEVPEPLWFCLDSGNLHGILVEPHAAKPLGLDEQGPVTLQIGDVAYEAPGEVMDMIYDGALDVGFFKSHEISIDVGNRKAWFKPVD